MNDLLHCALQNLRRLIQITIHETLEFDGYDPIQMIIFPSNIHSLNQSLRHGDYILVSYRLLPQQMNMD